MPKKSFKNNPALAFINAQDDTQYDAHEATQHHAQEVTQHDAHDVVGTGSNGNRSYVRTQGRSGHKKPRINLAFDSVEFLESIRTRAEHEGKGITQFVNEAVAYYLNMT